MTCPMREIGSGAEHCPYDWLAVYDGRDDHAPLIGKFCGVGKFPFSIIGNALLFIFHNVWLSVLSTNAYNQPYTIMCFV